MEIKRKSILIHAIINKLRDNVHDKNRELVKQNFPQKQEAFDAGDMFFKLAFMTDAEIEHLASLVI